MIYIKYNWPKYFLYVILMPFTLNDKTNAMTLCQAQLEALKKHSEQTRYNPRLILEGIPALDIKLDPYDSTWLYVDPLLSHTVHKIKVHIPLQNWRDSALMLANGIKENRTSAMAGIKTINPLLMEADLDALFCRDRIEKTTPITIYFVESAKPCEIAGVIHLINQWMVEVDKVHPLHAFESAASDQTLGFCSITIHGSEQIESIDERSEEGIRRRQDLLRNSGEIKDIQAILRLLAKIDAYIQDRKTQGVYTSCWGSLFSLFGSYTKDRKIEAAEKLKTAIIENKFIPEYYQDPLKQGNLGSLFKEYKQILPVLPEMPSYLNSEAQIR